jgi:hypothetical protein
VAKYLTIEQIAERLKTSNLTKVSIETGVHYETVRKAYKGVNIGYEAGRKLAEFLDR